MTEPQEEGIEVAEEQRYARMEVPCDLTEEDFAALYKFKAGNRPVSWPGLLGDALPILGLVAGALLVCWRELSVVGFFVAAGVALPVIVGYLALVWMVRRAWALRAARRAARWVRPELLKQKVLLNYRGVHVDQELLTSWFSWKVIESFGVTDDHVFIEVPGGVYVVPRRAFRDDLEFRMFLGTARHYREDLLEEAGDRTGPRGAGFTPGGRAPPPPG
jgi:hypothetical protein